MSDPTDDEVRAIIFDRKPQTAHFANEAQLDGPASAIAQHKVYRLVPYVTVRAKGEPDFISVPATREHQQQFPDAWKKFQSRASAVLPSSLLHLPTIDKAIVRELQELGIGTVELLAAAPIAETVTVVEDTDEDAPEREPPGILPAALAKWQRIANAYLTLKQFALTGEKPRIRLESVA